MSEAQPPGVLSARESDTEARAPDDWVTVLFTDLVGSTQLWATDPDRAAVVVAEQAEVVSTAVANHRGRVLKNLGDGLLAVFSDPAAAVRAAISAQGMLPATTRVRMGIHSGPASERDGDYFGTTVNTAARVEAAAHGGQILVTGDTWAVMGDDPAVGVHDFGRHYLRGLPTPIQLLQVLHDGVDQCPLPKTESRPNRPSIAVLPFTTGGTSDHAEFADGLAEDIVIGLSRCHDLFVIARNSTMGLAGDGDPGLISARLGCRFLLMGSIRWSGQRARINVRIVDGANSGTVWSGQYDRDTGDVFAVYDDITAEVVSHLSGYHGVLVLTEKQRTSAQDPGTLSDYETYMRALNLKHQFTPEANWECRDLFTSVLQQQPSFARAHVAVAWTWLFEVWWGWTATPSVSLENAWVAARQALTLDQLDAETYWLHAELHMMAGDFAQTEASYRRALDLNPSLADVHANWAGTANRLGLHSEALDAMQTAMSLNPNYPIWYRWFHGAALFGAGDAAGAVDVLETCAAHTVVSQAYLGAALWSVGRTDEAHLAISSAKQFMPNLTARSLVTMETFRDPVDETRLKQAVIACGLPAD